MVNEGFFYAYLSQIVIHSCPLCYSRYRGIVYIDEEITSLRNKNMTKAEYIKAIMEQEKCGEKEARQYLTVAGVSFLKNFKQLEEISIESK